MANPGGSRVVFPGGQPGGGPPGPPPSSRIPGNREGTLADLWHRHPWLVVTAVGAAGVAAYVFWKNHLAEQKPQTPGTGAGHGGHWRTAVLHTGGGGGGGHDPRRHHDRIHGGGADVTGAGGNMAGQDESQLLDQVGSLQDSLESYTLAKQRGVMPGGPNPGAQPAAGPADVPSFGSVPMP